jgi:hypothetical protein
LETARDGPIAMQAPSTEEEIPPPGVIFDSDLGASLDGLLALALLYGAGGEKDAKVRLASVSISRPDLQAAAFAEALGGFYSDISNREIPERFRRRRSLPVGLAEGTAPGSTPAMLAETLAKKNDKGEPLYPHEIFHLNDTAEVAALIRNALTAHHDNNSMVCLAGPATNLVRVLDVAGAKDWIERKARFLSVAMGSFAGDAVDPHTAADIPAAQRLFEGWPSPIVAAGMETGEAVLFPSPAALEAKLGWTDRHPILDAYRASGKDSCPTWSMAAALYTARAEDGFFKLSEPGVISIGADGRASFSPGGHGRHRYLVFDPEQKQRLEHAYLDLVATEPAPRELPGFLKRIIEAEKKKQQEEEAAKKKPPTQ